MNPEGQKVGSTIGNDRPFYGTVLMDCTMGRQKKSQTCPVLGRLTVVMPAKGEGSASHCLLYCLLCFLQ